jgi:hypothetical protein
MSDKHYIRVFTEVDDGKGQPTTETMWAKQLTRNTAKLESVPFFAKGMAYGDIIRFSRKNKITKVMDKVNKTATIKFYYVAEDDTEDERLKEILSLIRDALQERGINHTEAIQPYLAITVPLNATPEDLGVLLDEVNTRIGEPLIEAVYFSG